MKIVVIGINHAGTSAVRTLLEQNPAHEVIAIDRNDNISFLGCGIALSVAGVVHDMNDLFYSNPTQLTEMGAKLYLNTDVIKIDQAHKTVCAVNLKTKAPLQFTYDKLIYAAGSWPITSGAKNCTLAKIVQCKTYQHAQYLVKQADDKQIETVTIVGAGYIGLELAEAFVQRHKCVHLVDAQSHILASYVDQDLAEIITKALIEHGINLHLDSKILEYQGVDRVQQVVTTKTKFATDFVIECIGFKPNHQLLENVTKVTNKAIQVNEFCQTSDPNVYAIGDVAAYFDAASQTYRQIALATNAIKSGLVSAFHINGITKAQLIAVTGTNALSIFHKTIAATGLNLDQAKKLKLNVKSVSYTDKDRCEFYLKEKIDDVIIHLVYEVDSLRLVGAQIMSFDKANHSEWIYALSLAIQQKFNLFQLALIDVYFLPHLNKPFNFVLSAILKTLGLSYFNHETKTIERKK